MGKDLDLPRIGFLRIIISINHRSMIAQIQTYFSYFFGKFIALALFLIILTSFNLQIITATAQATAPAGNGTGTVTPPTVDPAKPNLSKDFSQGQDSRIGSLKNCSINNKNGDNLKKDPNAANDFIYNCLKDIIQIIITISVILAVMRLIFIGIKFLNTFGDENALNQELSKSISGFVAGAVILGLFATIIQVVNPSALKIDKIFSAQVIADYKCLNKGIGDVKGVKTVDAKGCTNKSQGSGPTTSNEVYTSESIKSLFTVEKPTDEQLTKQKEVIAAIKECNKNPSTISDTAAEAIRCELYQQDFSSIPALNEVSSSSVDAVLEPNMSTNRFAKGTYSNITVNGKIITADYTRSGSSKTKKVIFEYFEGCENSPLLTEKTITSGKPINYEGCNMDISSNK